MKLEKTLLSILSTRDNFDRFYPITKTLDLSEDAQKFSVALERYFEKYPASTAATVDWPTFLEWIKVSDPVKVCGLDMPTVNTVVAEVSKTLVAPDDPVLVVLLQRSTAERIMHKAFEVAAGKKGTLAEIGAELDKYEVQTHSIQSDVFHDPADLVCKLSLVATTGGLNWRLEDLNVCIGPVSRGDLVLVTARPEVGKTTFALSEITHFVEQLKEGTVLVFNNEEKPEAIGSRVVQAALGRSTTDILKNPVRAGHDYKAWLGENRFIGVVSDPTMDVRRVEGFCRKHKPKAIVFNILDKINGFEGDTTEVQRLRNIFVWARTLAYKYGPVIGLMQADASAEGEKYLNMSQIYGSKTGVQGESDVIIAIGMSHDPSEQDLRFFAIPKNKLPGGPKTDPSRRHGRFVTDIDVLKARYKTKIGT